MRLLGAPERARLLARQLDLHDRLGALVAVLPGHDQAHGRAVLPQQRLAVDAGRQQRQIVHGLVEPQPLVVRPGVPAGAAHARHLVADHDRLEAHVARVGRRLDPLQQPAQREAGPRHVHRPALYAAEVVQPLLVFEGEQVVQVERCRPVARAAHLDLPRLHLEVAAELPHRPAAPGQELVEVVVRRGRLARRRVAGVAPPARPAQHRHRVQDAVGEGIVRVAGRREDVRALERHLQQAGLRLRGGPGGGGGGQQPAPHGRQEPPPADLRRARAEEHLRRRDAPRRDVCKVSPAHGAAGTPACAAAAATARRSGRCGCRRRRRPARSRRPPRWRRCRGSRARSTGSSRSPRPPAYRDPRAPRAT